MALKPLEIRVQPAIKHYGPPEAYKNDSCPRGAVFIANYRNFDKCKTYRLKKRTGTEVNVRQLEELFTQMKYEVTAFDDLGTKDDTMAALENFRQLDIHKNADSLIVIFSSHGKEDEFFTSDGQLIHYKSIYQIFSDENCPDLIGKPKVFMFQFCRSEQGSTSIPSSGFQAHRRTRRGVTCTYVCLSTAEGRESYRMDAEGALFFHEVCKIFMENAKDKDFDTLIKSVSEKLPENQPTETQQWCLKKHFYFNPPLIGQEAATHNSISVPSETYLPAEPFELQMDRVYKMSSNPKGKVLIINNLDGCKDDESKLQDIFHQLGFITLRPINNVSYEELRTHFEDFKMQKHYDAAIIIIYGCGFEDHVVCSDNKAISYRDIIKMFQGENCSELEGKPKIFIINSCCSDNPSAKQVDQEQTGDSNLRPTEPEIIKEKIVSKAADKDTLIYGVEVEGGNCEQGSLLTEALYQVLLAKQNSETELIPLLRQVSDTLEKLSEEGTAEYFVVTYNFRFEKDFYFSPQNPYPLVTSTVRSPTGRHNLLHRDRIAITAIKTPIVGNTSYKNTKLPHGKAIIICFSTYKSEQLPKSYELFNEVHKYRHIVEDLGYAVKILKNCTHESIKSSLKTLDGTDAVDSLIIIAFGYAKDVNNLYDVNGQELPVSDIFHAFTDSQYPDMRGKPKLFFFHMTVFHNLQECCLLPPKIDLQDAFAYFLVCSLSDNSEQHPRAGLEYIFAELERGSSATDVESIIREAEEQLARHPEKQKRERFLIMPLQFQKEFFFNPTPLTKQ
ncbi:uncharacterized protein [Macrobrachium rosenbergii]|uniref:uncharacterized protein n=1 Tax=Macrobrachium rosenbergii TaxID=79674 RepID=UPI0034D51C52